MINYDYAGHFAHDHSLYLPRSLERASALASTIHDSVIPPFYVGIREPTHNNGSNACRSPLFRTGMSERLHLRYRIATWLCGTVAYHNRIKESVDIRQSYNEVPCLLPNSSSRPSDPPSGRAPTAYYPWYIMRPVSMVSQSYDVGINYPGEYSRRNVVNLAACRLYLGSPVHGRSCREDRSLQASIVQRLRRLSLHHVHDERKWSGTAS